MHNGATGFFMSSSGPDTLPRRYNVRGNLLEDSIRPERNLMEATGEVTKTDPGIAVSGPRATTGTPLMMGKPLEAPKNEPKKELGSH